MVDLKPKLLVTNKWWRDSKLGITKNLSLRFVYSIFNVIRTAKEFTVLLAGILGILLLVFSFWLVHTSDVQEQKVRGALIDIDEFFDDVIGGLNYLTTELPNEVTTFANNSVMILEQTGNSFLNDAAKYVEIGINKLVKGVQDSVNSVARWGYRISGRNQNDAPQIQLPTVDVPDKVLPDYWRPVIPWLDLSSARIPDRPFSAERECYPVVQKVYDIPRTTAYYAKVIGSILCGYAGLRLLIALITAFIPHCELYCCGGGFMKCMKLTGQSAENFFGTLARPWIHIPITVGIMLVLLCVLFLNPGIKQVDRDIRIPLKLADEQTAFAIGFVNDYIEKLPKDAIDFLNDQLRYIEGDVRTILTPSVYDLLRGVNTVIRTVNLEINDFLDGIDAGEVTIPTVDNSEGGLLLPRRLLPDIPHIPTDEMLIPPDLVALEPPLSPWIDDRIEEMNGISNQIIEVAIYLIAIPGIVVFWNTSKIWIPHKITEFFLHPPFDEETEHTKIPAATQLDLEAEE